MNAALEICRLRPEMEPLLAHFFDELARVDKQYFHPHPFDAATAKRIAHYAGRDLYYAAICGEQIVGYGMLRGWDEGYDVPSLGLAVHPQSRGMGIGKLLMHFLHAAARCRGATQVRLKVHRENEVALAMYQRLGYAFEVEDETRDGQVVGMIEL